MWMYKHAISVSQNLEWVALIGPHAWWPSKEESLSPELEDSNPPSATPTASHGPFWSGETDRGREETNGKAGVALMGGTGV